MTTMKGHETATSAEASRLAHAAKVLRTLDSDATSGPWGVGNGTTVGQNMEQVARGRCRFTQKVTEPDPWDYEDTSDSPEAQARHDATFIAAMRPIAGPLADWLVESAEVFERDPDMVPAEAFNLADVVLQNCTG